MSSNTEPLINTTPTPSVLTSLTSSITRILYDIDNISSFSLQTGGIFSIYVDRYANVGINTTSPATQLEVSSLNGSCLRLRYKNTSAYSDLFMNNSGHLIISPSGSETIINNNLNLIDHNGSSIGLKLNNTLVTATATELNYNDTTPGSAQASKALILDSSSNISNINSISTTTLTLGGNTLGATESFYLTNITSGTVSSSKALIVDNNKDISSIRNLGLTGSLSGGTTISHTNTYTNTLTTATTSSATGSLLLSGGIGITNTTDASSVSNGGTITTEGGVAIGKKLYVGSDLNVVGILSSTNTTNATNSTTGSIKTTGGISSVQDMYAGGTVIATIPIATTSGGTGTNTYQQGDILVGTNTDTLTKISAPNNLGSLISYDPNSNIYWDYNYITNNYVYFQPPTILSSSTYTFGQFYGHDSTKTERVQITATSNSINLASFGINGIGSTDGNLTGNIYATPSSTTITGVSTLFTTELNPYVVITIAGQSRKILSITNDTTAIIDQAFTVLNTWTLGATGTFTTAAGTFKFGAAALNCANATTSFALLTIGFPNLNYTSSASNLWTVEFWIRRSTTASVLCASATANTFRLNMTNAGALTLFLGQGTTFNIANGLAITGALTASVYSHLAIQFTGTSYTVYRDGVLSLTVTSSLPLTSTCFNSFYVGSNTATACNGQIDEFRISNIVRYTTGFSVATSAFTMDSNTLSLNHFENTSSITLSDDASTSLPETRLPYKLDGVVYSNTVYYAYAITNTTNLNAYIFSSNSAGPQLPSGYTHYSSVPFYVATNSSAGWIATNFSGSGFVNGGLYCYMNEITIINAATNVTPTILNTSLVNFVPYNATKLLLNITHAHITNTSCGITIGHSSLSMTNTLLTTATASTIYTTYTLPLATNNIDTFLTAAAGVTTYTVKIVGFYT